MTKLFLLFFKLKIGAPIFPPKDKLFLLFFNRCANNLQVVDFPLVPVTTMLLDFLLVR